MFATMKKILARYYKLTFIPSLVLGLLATFGLDLIGWYQGEASEQFCEMYRLFGPFFLFLFVMTAEDAVYFIRYKLAKMKS